MVGSQQRWFNGGEVKMSLDLTNHKTAIFGLQGSGKTQLSKTLLKAFRKPAVYRVTPDFDNENVYLLQPNSIEGDFDKHVKWFIHSPCDVLLVDEADLFLGNNFDLRKFPNFHELILKHRHFGKSLILISRRPQDIPTKILESCKYTIWFKVGDGENVMRKMGEISKDLPILMNQLQYKDYRYIIKEVGVAPYIRNGV